MSWIPGKNAPALVSNGSAEILNLVSLQLVGNLITNFKKLPTEVLKPLHEVLGGTCTRKSVDPLTVLACYLGITVKTLRNCKGMEGALVLGIAPRVFVRRTANRLPQPWRHGCDRGPGEHARVRPALGLRLPSVTRAL